jgi:hypothetical protein
MGLKIPPDRPFNRGPQVLATWTGVFGLLLVYGGRNRRGLVRRGRTLGLFVCLLAIGMGMPACGGGGGGGQSGAGTPAGTYTLTIDAGYTSGNFTLKHSSQATLIVN